MKKIGILLSLAFSLFASIGLGLGAFFIVTYYNRSDNKRFEAAYIYDSSFNEKVNVELDPINPGESSVFSIPVVSLLNHLVVMNISFTGEKNEINKYLMISFDEQESDISLAKYIDEKTTYTVNLRPKEERGIKMKYSLSEDFDNSQEREFVFSILIHAEDRPLFNG